MIHEPDYIKTLLRRHITGKINQHEEKMLLLGVQLYEDEELVKFIQEIFDSVKEVPDFFTIDWRPTAKDVIKSSQQANRKKRSEMILSIAASLFFVAIVSVLGWMLLTPRHLNYSCDHSGPSNTEFLPGINKCRVTLSNGCTITIDSSYTGKVTRQGSYDIRRLESGTLVYENVTDEIADDTLYNTITTSEGAQYRVVLPDGHKVILNAMSSIRIPIISVSTEMHVEVWGEVYFDNSGSKNMLCVHTGKTIFKMNSGKVNVNGYSDEASITLISGEPIKIKYEANLVDLDPDRQIVISDNFTNRSSEGSTLISDADTAQVISWQKPVRIYQNMENKEFIKDIARWYDLEIVNIRNVPSGTVSGEFCYDTPLEKILNRIRLEGMRFKREGKQLIFYS